VKNNRLEDIINEGKEHFIAKFFVMTSILNSDDHAVEYQAFYKSQGKGRWNPQCLEYSNLQYIVLKQFEVFYFRDIFDEQYETIVFNDHGKIYTHKEIGFNKEGIRPLKNQVTLFEQ
jgi:hypothetical protein